MAKKRKKKGNVAQPESSIGGGQPTHWMIVAAIFVFFSAAFVLKIVFTPVSGTGIGLAGYGPNSGGSAALESQVKLVTANFRCACGKCGELFLVDCTCDMPRGAIEQKDFIRNKLQQGLTVDQVIQLVDQEYGHRIG
jgi:hypothetical protein